MCSISVVQAQNLPDIKKSYAVQLSEQAAAIRGTNVTPERRREAETLLLSGLNNCTNSEDSKSCESIIYYALGYYNHQDAASVNYSNQQL